MTEDRETGVGFGQLDDDLEDETYPLSNQEVLDRYGERTVTYADGGEQLDQVLGSLENTYESAEGVRQAVFAMVGDEAIGRENYSDRGSTSQDEEDQESL